MDEPRVRIRQQAKLTARARSDEFGRGFMLQRTREPGCGGFPRGQQILVAGAGVGMVHDRHGNEAAGRSGGIEVVVDRHDVRPDVGIIAAERTHPALGEPATARGRRTAARLDVALDIRDGIDAELDPGDLAVCVGRLVKHRVSALSGGAAFATSPLWITAALHLRSNWLQHRRHLYGGKDAE